MDTSPSTHDNPTPSDGTPSLPDSTESTLGPSTSQPSENPSLQPATDDENDHDYPEPSEDRNPEPPPELLGRQDLIEADKIGDTVFSKHWLFTTLMRLIQVVDAESESKECTVTEAGVDIGDNLQDELCKLWDMSMNGEVVTFLQEFKAVDIFTGVVAKSKAPRATEICIGIFGNMACNDAACEEMAANKKLIDIVLLLLSDPDTPTLVETTRLLLTVISNSVHRRAWISAIKEKDTFLGDVIFILSSSTNNDLLRNAAMFLDKLLDVEEELCVAFALPQLVDAILEAIKQTGIQPGDAMEAYLHILQLLSTTEIGVTSLLANSDAVCKVMLQYLLKICEEDIVIVEGYENAIASTLSTLNVIIASSQDQQKYILEDFELIRCILKILEVVFPKIYPHKREERRHRRRRQSRLSLSETSPSHKGSVQDEVMEVMAEQDFSKNQLDVHGHSPPLVKFANGSKRIDGTPRKDPDVEHDKVRTKILYEVLQAFAVDVFTILNVEEALEEVPSGLQYLDEQAPRYRIYHLVWTLQQDHTATSTDDSNPDKPQVAEGQTDTTDSDRTVGKADVKGTTGHIDEKADVKIDDNKVKGHLEVKGHPKVTALMHIAELYRLERLERIIGDALSG